MSMQLLPGAVKTRAGTMREFQGKNRGKMKMKKKLKPKAWDNHMLLKMSGELETRGSLLKACLQHVIKTLRAFTR